ncbi:unnamed protein product [Ilex paraguariensis]|uniref:MnmG N-terminal domain-containing protein n=1 Tax=Ilex paraguariensis TaxID=185542 RepID=A0ABC8UAT0_9AQUA
MIWLWSGKPTEELYKKIEERSGEAEFGEKLPYTLFVFSSSPTSIAMRFNDFSVTASSSRDWSTLVEGADERYDVIVVGGGHAGCEAALASARLGAKTLLLTLNIDRIAWQPCNPAVGGPAKSQLVHEVDALGGEIGKAADRSGEAEFGEKLPYTLFVFSSSPTSIAMRFNEHQNLTFRPNIGRKFSLFISKLPRSFSVTGSSSRDWSTLVKGADERYDVIVVGGGHAGCEAALASARLGAKTLLLTLNIDRIAWQPCNPAVGGPAKSQLVHEVDALGGEIGKAADR